MKYIPTRILPTEYRQQLLSEMVDIFTEARQIAEQQFLPKKRLLNAKELKKQLSIGEETLKELHLQGLKYAKIGREYKYDIEDVYAVINKLKI